MAKVLDPFHSSKAKGSIGGITATRSGVGAVLKCKPRPPRRARPGQPRIRSILGWVARRYGELTQDQRDQWEAYATDHPQPDGFGGTFILTPEQAYLMLNIVAVRWFGPGMWQDTPPVDPPAASLVQITPSDGPAPGQVTLTVSLLGTGLVDDHIIFQRAGPFQSRGRVEVHNRYRDTKFVDGNVTEYTYENLVVDMWYWFHARYIDKYGQTTNWVVCQYQAPTLGP